MLEQAIRKNIPIRPRLLEHVDGLEVVVELLLDLTRCDAPRT
jgi:hypothetical protein